MSDGQEEEEDELSRGDSYYAPLEGSNQLEAGNENNSPTDRLTTLQKLIAQKKSKK